VTDYTIKFVTEHTLYPPASVKIEFPPALISPPKDTVIIIKAIDPTEKEYFTATNGVVTSGNMIKIEEIFGG